MKKLLLVAALLLSIAASAFAQCVQVVDAAVTQLESMGIAHEAIRTDAATGKRFVFFYNPDRQPLELYEK